MARPEGAWASSSRRPTPRRPRIDSALVGGVKEVGFAVSESFSQIGRVFGLDGVGSVFGLLFNDEERTPR